MDIRPIKEQDAGKWQELMILLDQQSNTMMLEPGERPEDAEEALGRIREAQRRDGLILVAEVDERLVGYLSADRGAYRRNRHRAEIVVGILKDYRGQGIGGKLFDRLDEWAGHAGITRLELTVVCNNNIAVHLYQSKGFKIEGVKKNSLVVDGRSVNEYFMAKVRTDPQQQMAALAALLQDRMVPPNATP